LVLATIPPLLLVSGVIKDWKALAIAFFSAAMAGAAIMVRPIGILIPFLVPIPFLFVPAPRTRRLAMALIAFAIPLLTILGWSARNYAVAGYFGISSGGPINLYFFRAAEVVARENRAGLLETQDEMGSRLGVKMDRIYDADVQSPALAHRMDSLAKQVLLAHPVQALEMTAQTSVYIALFPMRTQLAYMIGTTGGSEGWGLSAGTPSVSRFRTELDKMLHSPLLSALIAFQVLMTIAVWVGVAWALLRCLDAPAGYRAWTLYLTLVALVLIVIGAGGEADVRFREPVVPLLATVAALGYFPAVSRVRQLGWAARPLFSRSRTN
jgi:hypothetical protein